MEPVSITYNFQCGKVNELKREKRFFLLAGTLLSRLGSPMNARRRLFLVFFGLSALILLSFRIWGEGYERLFSGEGAREFFAARADWAGPAGAGLLIADLLLPVPSTGIIGGMGAVLGFAPAFLWGWLGLCLSGCAGYSLARLGGPRLADRLASPAEQIRYQALFNSLGGLAIVITRLLPVLPEVLSVLAGLYRMRFSAFFLATLLGSIPPALVYSWLGARALETPGPALWGFVAVTALAWLAFLRLRSHSRKTPRTPADQV